MRSLFSSKLLCSFQLITICLILGHVAVTTEIETTCHYPVHLCPRSSTRLSPACFTQFKSVKNQSWGQGHSYAENVVVSSIYGWLKEILTLP